MYLIVGLHCPLIAYKLNINLYWWQVSKTNIDGKEGLGINKLIKRYTLYLSNHQETKSYGSFGMEHLKVLL